MFVFRCCAVHCGETCGRLTSITLQIINVNNTATYNCYSHAVSAVFRARVMEKKQHTAKFLNGK